MTGKRLSPDERAEVDFGRRFERPMDERAEDKDTVRLVAEFQAGDENAFSTLYTRYFERAFGYFRVAVKDLHEAEDLAQQVFMRIFEKLPTYQQRNQPFRAWLFVIVRNHAINYIRKQARVEPVDPAELDRYRDEAVEDVVVMTAEEEAAAAWMLEWINDADLLFLIERLPVTQRRVLAMRFLLGLETKEIAATLGLTETNVRGLQYRGLVFLRKRLKALGRIGENGELIPMRARFQQAPVLRNRRFSLKP